MAAFHSLEELCTLTFTKALSPKTKKGRRFAQCLALSGANSHTPQVISQQGSPGCLMKGHPHMENTESGHSQVTFARAGSTSCLALSTTPAYCEFISAYPLSSIPSPLPQPCCCLSYKPLIPFSELVSSLSHTLLRPCFPHCLASLAGLRVTAAGWRRERHCQSET